MRREEAIDLVRECLLRVQPDGLDANAVDEGMRLIGGNSPLDSIALVSLIAELEQEISDRYGVTATLADDRAMSEEHSPFRSVETLAVLVAKRLEEAQPE